MSFFTVFGAFGIAASVLGRAHISGILGEGPTAFFAIVLVVAGIIFPFFGALQSKKPPTEGEKDESVDQALKALDLATKALEAKKNG